MISKDKKLIKKVNENYAGRASISPILDLFISMLECGTKGYQKQLQLRTENFQKFKSRLTEWAEKNNEKIVLNVRNKISMALTLKNIGKERAKDLGARLYRKGVMGARVCVQSYFLKEKSDSQNSKNLETQKESENQQPIVKETNLKIFQNGNLKFRNFGGHIENSEYSAFPYITVAAAVGSNWEELEVFLKRFDSVYQKLRTEIQKNNK